MKTNYKNITRFLYICLLTLLIILFLKPAIPVNADAGPKPSMHFTLQFEVSPTSILDARLLECEDEACNLSTPLESVGPQHFRCTDQECSSTAYGYSEYLKVEIKFSDRIRVSNVFSRSSYFSEYILLVEKDALRIEDASPLWSRICCPASLLTILIELLVAFIYISAFQLPKIVLGWIPLASVFTLPLLWFVFPLFGLPFALMILLGELFVVASEFAFLRWIMHGAVSLRHLAALAIIMNLTSFLVGVIIL